MIVSTRHDALLLLSFGGPEGPDDVMPFLRNVVKGRDVPDERLAEVAKQYEQFGGISPINAQNRALIEALSAEFATSNLDLPIYWGNRNWPPFVDDTVQQMAADGITSALVFVTSAFGSYSGCRQYRENLEAAAEAVDGPTEAPTLQKLRLFYNHPGFIEPAAERLQAAVSEHRALDDGAAPPHIVFTAHSIPVSMAEHCEYEEQLREAAELVAERVEGAETWELAFQSRSGPPRVPWLEPDIGDRLRSLIDDGVADVVVAPLGFVSDHMEVLFDLDTQAAEIAADLGIRMTRAGTVGTHPRFVAMIRELVEEQLHAAPRLSLGSSGPWPDWCPEGHCRPPERPQSQPS